MYKSCLFIVITIVIHGCGSPEDYKNRYTLNADDHPLEIPIGKDTKNFVYYYHSVTLEGVNYLAILNIEQNTIEIYNLDKGQLYKELKFKMEGPETFGEVTCFFIENLDSIMVDNMSQRFIAVTDAEGRVKKKISYREDIYGRDFKTTPPWSGLRPYKVGNTINYLQSYGMDESEGILTSEMQKTTCLNVSVDIVTGQSYSSGVTYPEELIGEDISNMYEMRTLGHRNSFIYHFGNLNYLFVTNDHIKFERIPLESNYDLHFNNSYWKYRYDIRQSLTNSLRHDMVRDILYDSYRDCYYLMIMKGDDGLDVNSDVFLRFKFPECFVLILNKDLKHIGEVKLPDNTYSFQFSFITPDGLYISEDHPNNPDFDEDFMRFRLFKLQKL